MTFPLTAPMFDLLVLSVISEGDAYGYQISQIIKRAANTKDSTLYPILRRLQQSNYVKTYDQQYQGRNRKYYTITEEGRQYQKKLALEWTQYRTIVDSIVEGGMTHE